MAFRARKVFGTFLKLQPAYSVKLVFSYVAKGIKITAKFRASRRFRFEDTKRIMSPEKRPKSFGTFEKRAPEIQIAIENIEKRHNIQTKLPLSAVLNNNFHLIKDGTHPK